MSRYDELLDWVRHTSPEACAERIQEIEAEREALALALAWAEQGIHDAEQRMSADLLKARARRGQAVDGRAEG